MEKSLSDPYELMTLLTVILLDLSKNHCVHGYMYLIFSTGSYFSDLLPQFNFISNWKC